MREPPEDPELLELLPEEPLLREPPEEPELLETEEPEERDGELYELLDPLVRDGDE